MKKFSKSEEIKKDREEELIDIFHDLMDQFDYKFHHTSESGITETKDIIVLVFNVGKLDMGPKNIKEFKNTFNSLSLMMDGLDKELSRSMDFMFNSYKISILIPPATNIINLRISFTYEGQRKIFTTWGEDHNYHLAIDDQMLRSNIENKLIDISDVEVIFKVTYNNKKIVVKFDARYFISDDQLNDLGHDIIHDHKNELISLNGDRSGHHIIQSFSVGDFQIIFNISDRVKNFEVV